jgi:hypothetical protein
MTTPAIDPVAWASARDDVLMHRPSTINNIDNVRMISSLIEMDEEAMLTPCP